MPVPCATVPGPRGLTVYVERCSVHSTRFRFFTPHRSYVSVRTCGTVRAALALARRYAAAFC